MTSEAPQEEISKPQGLEVVWLNIDDIYIPDVRVTAVMDHETFEELKQSIKERGILTPILVAKQGDKYILIDGLHRIQAARELGIKKVPAVVREYDMPDVLIANLITARQKGTTNPADEARLIRTLHEEFGYDIKTIAKMTNLSVSTVRKYLDISKLPEEVLDALKYKRIGVDCAWAMTRLKDREKILQVLEWAIRFNYTTEQCQAAVQQFLVPDYKPPVGGWEITETGEPQKILPVCPVCGQPIESGGTYVWFHDECWRQLEAAIKEVNAAAAEASTGQGEEESRAQPPSTPLRRRGFSWGRPWG